MLKKCWSSGEYPFWSHDHRFRSLLHVHLERKETCEYEMVDVPGIVKTGRSSLRLTPVMIGNHQFLVIYFSPACWETFTPSDHSSCCSWFRTEARYRRAGEMDPGTSTVSFPDHPTSSLKLRRWWWGRVEGGRGWGGEGGMYTRNKLFQLCWEIVCLQWGLYRTLYATIYCYSQFHHAPLIEYFIL